MKKEFIKDEGKVRQCDSNLSKMNIIEFVYFKIFHWGYFQEMIYYYLWKNLKLFIEHLFYFIYNIAMFLLTPIILVLCAIVQIKNARERCNKNK